MIYQKPEIVDRGRVEQVIQGMQKGDDLSETGAPTPKTDSIPAYEADE